MTQRNENSETPAFDPECIIMEIAALTAPQESIDRVVASVLARTGNAADRMPPISKHPPHRQMLITGIALASAMMLLGTFIMNMQISGIAFAQAQQQLEKTLSVQYVEFMHPEEAKRTLPQLEKMLLELNATETNANFLNADPEQLQLHKAKLQDYIQQLSIQLKKGEPIELRRVWILGRSLHRAEQSEYGSKSVHITNSETGESITLRPDLKQCVLMKTQTVLNMQSGEKTVTSVGPNPARNFYSQFAEIPSEHVTSLGVRQIDGKAAVGFERTDNIQGSLIKRSYWVDPGTRLPIRLEAVASRNGIVIGGRTISNIVFDRNLDASLFSTTPPDGYVVSEEGFMSLDPGLLKE